MVPDTILPWQIREWQSLWQRYREHCLPHALLFVGRQGIGKRRFAHALSAALLCLAPSAEGQPCGQCHACHLMQAKSHPDFHIIEPEADSQTIKIDQIRQVVQVVNETAQQGGYRIILIHPTAAININAANALLKTLEEPSSQTLLILVSDQSIRTLPTLTSRCQKILFQTPSFETALDWLNPQVSNTDTQLLLNVVEGAPFKALEWVEKGMLTVRQDFYQALYAVSQGKTDPLKLALLWPEIDVILLLDLLLIWLKDLLRFKMTAGAATLINTDFLTFFAKIERQCSSVQLVEYMDHVQTLYANCIRSLNLNRQLLLEELFMKWAHYVSG